MAKRKPDQLDIDSTAAIEAGMSYGKYMATKKPVRIEKPKPEGKRFVCKCCGEVFYRSANYAYQFCSEGCRDKWQDIKDREDKTVAKCAICGNVFIPRSVNSKYCSDDCRTAAQYESTRKTNQKRKEAKVIPPRNCTYCGKEFTPKTLRIHYCGDFCRQMAHNDRQRESKRKKREQERNAKLTEGG